MDYQCTARAYDGHNGVDIDIRTFSEMGPDNSPVGMPIFAAADGVVLFTDDGHPDRNENCDSFDTNYVMLGHAGGQESWYFHMKRGSVAAQVGEQVVAGQQLGLVGSSGCSYAPHLHFETRVDGDVREAFSGECNEQPSLFANQPALNRTLYVRDGAVTNVDLAPFYPPDPLPAGGVIDRSTDQRVYLWLLEQNVPAHTTWTMRVRGPGGGVVFESGPWDFGNDGPIAWYFDWYFVDVALLGNQNGAYRFQLDLGGQQVIDAPFTIVASGGLANRPPNALQGAAIAPAQPEEGEVIACEVDLPLVNDDPDFDVLTFEYVWTVDGAEVRRVTSTGHKDVLPRTAASAGQVVRCAVSASDGAFTTAQVAAQATVRSACPADTNGDRVVNFADLNAALSDFGRSSGEGGLPADLNLDGVVNFADLNAVLSAFGLSCD